MNPWENFVTLLGYCFLAVLILIIGLVIYIIIAAAVQAVRKRRKLKRLSKPDKLAELKAVEDEATLAGMIRYRGGVAAEEQIRAFRDGANWAWYHLSK